MRTPVLGAGVRSLLEPPEQLLRKLTIRDDALLQRVLAKEECGCLLAVVPILGEPRVVSAAPKLGLALGYDVGAALEEAGSALG
jgi:hypothetical protein